MIRVRERPRFRVSGIVSHRAEISRVTRLVKASFIILRQAHRACRAVPGATPRPDTSPALSTARKSAPSGPTCSGRSPATATPRRPARPPAPGPSAARSPHQAGRAVEARSRTPRAPPVARLAAEHRQSRALQPQVHDRAQCQHLVVGQHQPALEQLVQARPAVAGKVKHRIVLHPLQDALQGGGLAREHARALKARTNCRYLAGRIGQPTSRHEPWLVHGEQVAQLENLNMSMEVFVVPGISRFRERANVVTS